MIAGYTIGDRVEIAHTGPTPFRFSERPQKNNAFLWHFAEFPSLPFPLCPLDWLISSQLQKLLLRFPKMSKILSDTGKFIHNSSNKGIQEKKL